MRTQREPASITLDDVHAARDRIAGAVTRTPLIRLEGSHLELYLKLGPLEPARFIHPVSDVNVMAGNGTIGLEIVEDMPDVDAVLVPFGGGGLSCGIAAAIRGIRPEARVYGCEVETATPLRAAIAAGRAVESPRQQTFVDGIGAPTVLREMWPAAHRLLAGSLVVSLSEVAAAIRLLVQRAAVVAEGA